MSLATLPLDVLNEILQYLNSTHDLLNVSYTSKLLNQAANVYLYRDLSLHKYADKELKWSLQSNPSNAFHIRSYISIDPWRMRWLWSKPLTLHRLRLQWDVSEHYRSPYPRCMAARHPDLCIHELIIMYKSKLEKF